MNIRILSVVFFSSLILVSGCGNKTADEQIGSDKSVGHVEQGVEGGTEGVSQVSNLREVSKDGLLEGVHAEVPYDFYLAEGSATLARVVKKGTQDVVADGIVPEDITFYIWKESKSMWMSPSGRTIAFYSIEDNGTYFVALYDLSTLEELDRYTIPADRSVVSHYTNNSTVMELPEALWVSDTVFQVGVYAMPSPMDIPTEARDVLEVVTLEV